MTSKKFFIFIILMLTVSFIFPQYWWYYGKNKVRRTDFNWNYIETPNFFVYYYNQDVDFIKEIARHAEESYISISEYLNIKAEQKIPLIFYNTHIDFEQTNLFPGFLPMGVMAFAEPIGHRVVVHGDLPFWDLTETITHELGHILEYEVLYKGVRRSAMALRRPPDWVMEGFSEFMTQNWDSFSLMTIRDSVLNGRIPSLKKNWQMQTQYGGVRTSYDFGHLVFEFLNQKYGRRGVRNLLFSFRKGTVLNPRRNLYEIFATTEKELNHEFQKYARERFKDFRMKENPEDYSFSIGPDFPYIYSFSHQISPSGEVLAVLTGNIKKGALQIVLISMKDGKVIKNITPGLTSKYDNINYKFNPADGISFSWDDKSEKIAFFARQELDNYLVVMDVFGSRILKKIKMRGIQDPTSPDFMPDHRTIYFTGIEKSRSFIYSIDLETEEVRKHTEGKLFIRSINVSPDGKKIVYSAKAKDYYKLYLAPIEKPEMGIQLTTGNYHDITPIFSRDGKKIYFSSDELKSHNIYGIDLENQILCQYTDVMTANYFPIEIPEQTDKLVFSSFFKGSFMLFKKDIAIPLEERSIAFRPIEFPSPVLAEKPKPGTDKEKRYQPSTAITAAVGETGKEKPGPQTEAADAEAQFKVTGQGKYKPFKKLFVNALPSIGVGYSTTGDFLGYTYLNLTDLMGDHNFTLYMANQYGYQSFQVSYLNIKNRLQYYANLFSWNLRQFYLAADGYYIKSIRKQFGANLGFYYPFNRSYRVSFGASFYKQQDNAANIYYGTDLPFSQYFDGFALPLSISLTGETTRFNYYGPNMGHTFNLSLRKFIKVGSSFQDAYTFEGDIRKYFRIDNNTLLALRLRGFTSGGDTPMLYGMGGDNTIRASRYLELIGNSGFHLNAEFRFSIINAAATPIGLIGPIRGVFFFDLGGVWFKGEDFRFFRKGEGLRLEDPISSYGFGIQTFLFGIPMHFEWVYQTNLDSKKYYGFNFWIGFDF